MHDHRPGRTARADRRTRKRHHQAGVTTRQGPAEKADPFTAEMIKNGLIVACEEMFYAFGRTAMSPVIYEVLDYAVGIANAEGELVAQTPGVPGFSGVLDFVASDVLEKWRKEMRPGDVYVLNVPYRSGTHLNDVALVLPSFHKDDLLGLIINKGHWSEVGGMHFGSWTSDATEIFQEGMQFPNIRLYLEGKPNRDLIEMIRANSRLPDQTFGDMEAQIASMKVADRRIQKLIEKYGVDVIRASMDKLLEDGEKLAALKLKDLPKGTFEAEDYIDDDGITEDPLYVRAKVTISDDAFVVDFTGSAPQGKGSINSPLPGTVSGVRETYMAVMDPHALANAGFVRPIRVIAPDGSVFHAGRPPPTSRYRESVSYAVGRAKYPPWGVDGGTDGTPNTCIVFKHGREPMVARKVGGLKLVRGEKVSLRSGGGGGWGPPLERDPERVLSDVRNEYLTVEQARDIYGVVVEGMQVDGGRTQRRREEMRRGHRERRP